MDERTHRAPAHSRYGGYTNLKRGYFTSSQESHAHSRQTLDVLYEFDDFMESVEVMGDLGCGSGLDLEWWATRTTRDEFPRPLNIKCIGIDRTEGLPMAKKYTNMQYQSQDFETDLLWQKRKFDVLWCHDSFQYVLNPFATLSLWHQSMSKDGMLVIIVPQSTNIEYKQQAFDQRDKCYFHWTLVNLIHVLAVSGFDCADGFFKKNATDPWIHAVVYKSEIEPQNPANTTWYQLAETGLLPESAVASINRHGYLRQRDLVLPWLDRSAMSFHDH